MSAVRILRIAGGGDGVGKLEDGRTVFVPRSAPGDLVELGQVREQRRYARARVARLLEPSPDRVVPRCPHYVQDECGGCQLQHLAAPAQREARRTIVGDALRRIARLEAADPEVVPAPEEPVTAMMGWRCDMVRLAAPVTALYRPRLRAGTASVR